jgi:CIC family chloride channel protein
VGASLGLEAAPKLLGAAAGSLLARWTRLDPTQRRLLVACGGDVIGRDEQVRRPVC